MEKILILFTTSYPNTNGEVFVENEIRVLENYFDKILDICAVDKNKDIVRYIPKNTDVFVFNENLTFYQKLKGIPFFFMKIFWQEIIFAKKNLTIKFNFNKLKILYIDLIKGYLLCKYTQKILKKYSQATTIYCYSYWSDYEAIACAFLKKKNPQIKAFARNHRWDIYFYASTHKYLPLRKFIFDQLDAVYCIAQNGVDYLKNELKFQHNTIFVSKLGTYNKYKKNKPFEISNSFLIVSCSYLIPVKRIDLIIDALMLIHEIPITWFHFGDGILKESLIDRSNKLKPMNNLKFEFKGQTTNDDIMTFYEKNQVDLFINVSKSEGIPVTIMEAMSFGIPVIATAVGGIPEIVNHGYNGFLLPENPSPNDLADAIKSYYHLPIKETLRLRENAFEKWDGEYNAKKNYIKFIEEILKL